MTRRIDPVMASTFHVDWLVPLDATTEDDYTRAIAEKADVLLQSARFMAIQGAGPMAQGPGVDLEVRVWVEAAISNACVSITWEPGPRRFGFHLLDESLTERIGCIVFHELPCLDGEMSLTQADQILDAALFALSATHGRDVDEVADAVRAAKGSVRVTVRDARDE